MLRFSHGTQKRKKNKNYVSEREIKETIPFPITTKRIKYLGINLSKEKKYLYAENYKTVMKEIKHNSSRWRNIPFSSIWRINTGKWLCDPMQSTDSMQYYQTTNGNVHRTR